VWTLGFSIVHRETGHVIGTCGFKGPPSLDGIVEIAYGISPNEQGKGLNATEAADALVRYAIDSGQVPACDRPYVDAEQALAARTDLNAASNMLAK
jgi:RimJ/RimL family protein N-acetyltransferase